MATDTDIYQFVMDVQGGDKVENLTGAINLSKEALMELYGPLSKDTEALIGFAEAAEKTKGKTFEFADAGKVAAKEASDLAAQMAREAKEASDLVAAVDRASKEMADLASVENRAADVTQHLSAETLRTITMLSGLAESEERASRATVNMTTATAAASTKVTAAGHAADKAAVATVRAMGQGSDATTQFMQKVAFMADDLQYVGEQGLRPILNNLMMFSPYLGLAGIAVDQFIRHWDDLVRAFTGSGGHFNRTLDDMKARLKELEDSPHKLTVDYQTIQDAKREVDALEKALKAYDALKDRTTTTQQKVAKGVQDTIAEHAGGSDTETGEENLRKAIKAAMQREGTATSGFGEITTKQANLKQEIADFKSRQVKAKANPGTDEHEGWYTLWIKDREGKLAKVEADLDAAVGRRIQAIIGNANLGIDSARKQILDLIGRDKGAFAKAGIGDDFVKGLEKASPENVREAAKMGGVTQEELEKQGRDNARKFANDKRLEREKIHDKDVEEINRVRLELLAMDEAKAEKGEAVTRPQGGFEVETTAAERIQMAKQARELDEKLEKDRREGNRKDLEDNVKRFTGGPRGLDVQAGAALARNRVEQVNGVGVNDAAFQRELQQEIARFLFANHARDAAGRPLTKQQVSQIAAKVVSDAAAQERANFADIASRAADGFEVLQGVQQEYVQAMARFGGRMNAIANNGRRMQAQIREVTTSSLGGWIP